MRNNESGIIATVKMSHKGKSYQASSTVSRVLPTAITVSQQERQATVQELASHPN